jgi:hypothetical protein
MQPVPKELNLSQKPHTLMRTLLMRLWPLAIGLVLVLFPFDWLATVWPAYRQVFVGAREHHIGHSALFFIVGLLVLINFPSLLSRPLLYFGLLISAAIAQEAVQDLFKFVLPDLTDSLDLLFDAVGFTIAYLVVWGWRTVLTGKKRLTGY